MIYSFLMLAVVLAAYYFALAQRKCNIPYMWIERNLILICMSNLTISFYLYDYAVVAFAEPGFVVSITAIFTFLPVFIFSCFYEILKPITRNIYVFSE